MGRRDRADRLVPWDFLDFKASQDRQVQLALKDRADHLGPKAWLVRLALLAQAVRKVMSGPRGHLVRRGHQVR